MIKEAIKSSSHILFDPEKLETYDMNLPDADSLNDDAVYYQCLNRDPARIPETREEDVKAKSEAHVLNKPSWWPLEFLMFLENKQAKEGSWILRPQ